VVLIRIRWLPFVLGLSFIIGAIQDKWDFSLEKKHPTPVLIAVEVLLGLVCFYWAWWLRESRLRREAARSN
jgi:hypothetical protein